MGIGAGAQAGAADPTAAAGQAAQGQWASADPSTYYSNYWGGESLFLWLMSVTFNTDVHWQDTMASSLRRVVTLRAQLERRPSILNISCCRL